MKLSKTYDAGKYEKDVYDLWESRGVFAAGVHNARQQKNIFHNKLDKNAISRERKTRKCQDLDKNPPLKNREKSPATFSIVMPPPNANGNLHVGHALMLPIEDVLTRYHRMLGDDTVWIPGADHAGFETWTVFEKYLEAHGKTRFDFSRDELYQMTWDFVHQNRGNMEQQVRALGASVDWSINTFTLDDKVVASVYKTFKKMWDDGLVYRGERIVNYCTKHHTSFADIEVEFHSEKGKLWQIAYPFTESDGEIVVATTRPETLLGDVAIAVHPDDEKYRDLVGKTVRVPLTDREIPIVADEGVELGFGTGAVKITPAHDPLDFEIGQRHSLTPIEVITPEGKIAQNPEFARYADLDVVTARKTILADLKKAGALRGEQPYTHDVPHCYKCGTTIQPLLMKQWFVAVKTLAARAKTAVKQGKVKFYPATKAREIENYFSELRDWNISRQIPWGIPIPAFQNADDPDDWIFDTRVDRERITIDGKTYVRDNDTFDTWFSSGQWPFATTLTEENLAKYYPNSVMETGVDLLRQWVARMIMLGLYVTGEVPFRDVFFHGLVLDQHGQKMSKSKGNVVNPMDVIADYGADALRMGIMMNRGAAQPQAFSPATVVAGRNFTNKLWNVARFIEGKFGDDFEPDFAKFVVAETPAENWILSRLEAARCEIEASLANYNFAGAVDNIYHLLWDDFADWFVEASKTTSRAEFLSFALAEFLRLAHPFTPFVTEVIWTTLSSGDSLLATEEWPGEIIFDAKKAAEFDDLRECAREIRLAIAELPAGKYDLISADEFVMANAELLRALTNAREIHEKSANSGLKIASRKHEIRLDVADDLVKKHRQNLENRLESERADVAKLSARLENRGYVEHAPEKLVAETRAAILEKRAMIARLEGELAK